MTKGYNVGRLVSIKVPGSEKRVTMTVTEKEFQVGMKGYNLSDTDNGYDDIMKELTEIKGMLHEILLLIEIRSLGQTHTAQGETGE